MPKICLPVRSSREIDELRAVLATPPAKGKKKAEYDRKVSDASTRLRHLQSAPWSGRIELGLDDGKVVSFDVDHGVAEIPDEYVGHILSSYPGAKTVKESS